MLLGCGECFQRNGIFHPCPRHLFFPYVRPFFRAPGHVRHPLFFALFAAVYGRLLNFLLADYFVRALLAVLCPAPPFRHQNLQQKRWLRLW